MKAIKITTTLHFTRTASVVIELTSDLSYDDVADYLFENEHLYQDRLDKALESADTEFDAEQSRYDVTNDDKYVYGGTL
jgi:Mn-containing catalase